LEVPLAEATQAHRRVMEPGARGKVVLTIWALSWKQGLRRWPATSGCRSLTGCTETD